jgi:hypothetical protein
MPTHVNIYTNMILFVCIQLSIFACKCVLENKSLNLKGQSHKIFNIWSHLENGSEFTKIIRVILCYGP